MDIDISRHEWDEAMPQDKRYWAGIPQLRVRSEEGPVWVSVEIHDVCPECWRPLDGELGFADCCVPMGDAA